MSNGSARPRASAASRNGSKSPREAKRPAAQARPAHARGKGRTGTPARKVASAYVGQSAQGVASAGAQRFARSHPVWFLGGAFLTGLALARLLKATPPRELAPALVLPEQPTDTSIHASSDEGGFQ
jgi:hypothetical protein